MVCLKATNSYIYIYIYIYIISKVLSSWGFLKRLFFSLANKKAFLYFVCRSHGLMIYYYYYYAKEFWFSMILMTPSPPNQEKPCKYKSILESKVQGKRTQVVDLTQRKNKNKQSTKKKKKNKKKKKKKKADKTHR